MTACMDVRDDRDVLGTQEVRPYEGVEDVEEALVPVVSEPLEYDECRGCHAPIVWARHVRTGRTAPIDAFPSPDGNVLMDWATGEYMIVGAEDRGSYAKYATLHRNHFGTCARAKEFREQAHARKEGEGGRQGQGQGQEEEGGRQKAVGSEGGERVQGGGGSLRGAIPYQFDVRREIEALRLELVRALLLVVDVENVLNADALVIQSE